MIGALVMSIIIGQVSDMIAHANPGEKAKNDAVGLIHGFLHEKKISQPLTRRVRTFMSNMYQEKGTTEDVFLLMQKLPDKMMEDLGAELGWLHNHRSGRRGAFSKVGFLSNLPAQELCRLSSRLRLQRVVPSMTDQLNRQNRDPSEYDPDLPSGALYERGSAIHEYIMREGERGTQMWIIDEGQVRVERTNTNAEDSDPPMTLGKLREFDFFGELAVIAQERPGVPFKRMRSIYVISAFVVLHTLSFNDVTELRAESPSIDRAIRKTLSTLRTNRPTLFSPQFSEKRIVHARTAGRT